MKDEFFAFIMGVLVGAILLGAILGSLGQHTGMYKDGQIDALNGEVFYELQEQEDSTTHWVYVPEGVIRQGEEK